MEVLRNLTPPATNAQPNRISLMAACLAAPFIQSAPRARDGIFGDQHLFGRVKA
jgi:hypothetical protein